MNTRWKVLLSILLLSPMTAKAAPDDASTPQQAITQLVADATKAPYGPVENEVTSQTVSTCTAAKKGFSDSRSVRELIAASYNRATLSGPLTCLWSEGPAAIWSAKAKLTADGIDQCKDEASNNSETLIQNGKAVSTQVGSGPMFGDGGCFETFVGSKVPQDGQVIATFCVVQQHGLWKVHCGYISPGPLKSDDRSFIVREFSAFAKKA